MGINGFSWWKSNTFRAVYFLNENSTQWRAPSDFPIRCSMEATVVIKRLDKFFDKTSNCFPAADRERRNWTKRKKPGALNLKIAGIIPTQESSVAQNKRNPSLLPTKQAAILKEKLKHRPVFWAVFGKGLWVHTLDPEHWIPVPLIVAHFHSERRGEAEFYFVRLIPDPHRP